MRSPTLFVLFLLTVAFAAGGLSFAEEECPKTVKAKHYRLVFAESALHLSHGGGQWVEGLFLPDAKVAAMLVHDEEIKEGTSFELVPRVRLFAYHADKPENDSTGLHDEPSAIDEIEIPADLATEIVALAALTAKQQAETVRLGGAVTKRLGWKALPQDE